MLLHNPSRPSCNAGVLPSTPSRNSSCNAQNCSLQNYGARTYQSTSAQIKKTPGQLRPGDFCSVELTGFEPVTPTLPVWCATNCAIAPRCAHRSYTTRGMPSKSLVTALLRRPPDRADATVCARSTASVGFRGQRSTRPPRCRE